MRDVELLGKWVRDSERIAFFGGAGVSTESGIPDFRSADGLFRQAYAYPPEEILSIGFFRRNPEVFYEFYRDRVLYPDAEPNAAHKKIARWEGEGKLLGVVTQNIDGLHQKAGSKRVIELHGSVYRNYCVRCQRRYDLSEILNTSGVAKCGCGGVIRPDVVMYGEPLDAEVIERAIAAIARADLLIVGGTSLVVHPAAGLIEYYRGRRLAIVNRAPTAADARADCVVRGSIGEVFSAL